MPRRSKTLTTTISTPDDDLLLPVSGPNAVPAAKLTPRERRDEIIAILARGMLRKLKGIPPFTKPTVTGSPPGRVT
jgi:hypothetical protein